MNKPTWTVFFVVAFMAWGTYFILSQIQHAELPIHTPKYSLGLSRNYSERIEPPESSRRLHFFDDNKKLLSVRYDGWVEEWNLEENVSAPVAQTQDMFAFLPSSPGIVIREALQGVVKIPLESPTEKDFVTEGKYVHSAADSIGQFLALSKGSNQVEVWNLHEQKSVTTWMTKKPVRNGLDISEDGRLIATAEGTYDDSTNRHHTIIEVWGVVSEEPQLLWENQDSEIIRGVWHVLFSPDNSQLAMDTQIRGKSGFQIVNSQTGTLIVDQQGHDSYWMRSLAFSQDSHFLASGDEFGNITIWTTSDGTKVWHTQTGQVIESLSFSTNSHLLAAGLRDTTISIWDISSLKSTSN